MKQLGHTQREYQWPICGSMYTDLFKLKCGHSFWHECVLDYMEDEINSGHTNIACLQWEHLIDVDNLQGFLNDDLIKKYNSLIQRKEPGNLKWPMWSIENWYFKPDNIDDRNQTWPFGHYFCKICEKEGHEDNEWDKKIIVEVFNNAVAGNYRVAQCPVCHAIATKDKECEHVEWMNPQCGVDFCFFCSCLRQPTLIHGIHYHRPQWKFVVDVYTGRDIFNPDDWSEWRRLGRLWTRPDNLEIPRLYISKSDFKRIQDEIFNSSVLPEPDWQAWECEFCQHKNLYNEKIWEVCSQISNRTARRKKTDDEGPNAWICKFCTKLNGQNLYACSLCGKSNPNPPVVPQTPKSKRWICKNCTFINKNNATECEVCQEVNEFSCGFWSSKKGWICDQKSDTKILGENREQRDDEIVDPGRVEIENKKKSKKDTGQPKGCRCTLF